MSQITSVTREAPHGNITLCCLKWARKHILHWSRGTWHHMDSVTSLLQCFVQTTADISGWLLPLSLRLILYAFYLFHSNYNVLLSICSLLFSLTVFGVGDWNWGQDPQLLIYLWYLVPEERREGERVEMMLGLLVKACYILTTYGALPLMNLNPGQLESIDLCQPLW